MRTVFLKGKPYDVDKGTRLVVVREPFSRLFSAWTDKLLVPNDYYWKVI